MIEDFIEALVYYQEAKTRLEKAKENCIDNYSYYLSREIQNVENAKDQVSKLFEIAVADAVKKHINQHITNQ